MENRTWWNALTKLAQQEVRTERLKELEHRAECIKELAPRKTQQALDLADKKGSSAWLTVLPLQDFPQQIYRIHENEKKHLYSRRVLDIEHGTFTPFYTFDLIFL